MKQIRCRVDFIELILLFAAIGIICECVLSQKIDFPTSDLSDDDSPAQNHSSINYPTEVDYSCGRHKKRNVVRQMSHKHRIAGGYDANLGEFPSYVRVLSEPNVCGGTIISEWLVLTAAHCFNRTGTLNRAVILAGTVDEKRAQVYEAKSLCRPANITNGIESLKRDIAILVMKKPIKFGKNIQPVCLPQKDIGSTHQAYTVGTGLTSSGPFAKLSTKLKVLPVRKRSDCTVGVFAKLLGHACYASNDSKYLGNVCQGDSGGPVYTNINRRQTLVAIVSRSSPECTAGSDIGNGLHMNVFKLREYLEEIAETGCKRIQ